MITKTSISTHAHVSFPIYYFCNLLVHFVKSFTAEVIKRYIDIDSLRVTVDVFEVVVEIFEVVSGRSMF